MATFLFTVTWQATFPNTNKICYFFTTAYETQYHGNVYKTCIKRIKENRIVSILRLYQTKRDKNVRRVLKGEI